LVGDGIDVAEAERADEQRALVAPGHLPRRQHARGPDLDLEALRQLDLLDGAGELGIGGAGPRPGARCEPLLRLGLVAEEPVIRRMGPELLGARLVFLQRAVLVLLLLRMGKARPRNKPGCCQRKNGFMESRYHRVTPLLQPLVLRLLIVRNTFERRTFL